MGVFCITGLDKQTFHHKVVNIKKLLGQCKGGTSRMRN